MFAEEWLDTYRYPIRREPPVKLSAGFCKYGVVYGKPCLYNERISDRVIKYAVLVRDYLGAMRQDS